MKLINLERFAPGNSGLVGRRFSMSKLFLLIFRSACSHILGKRASIHVSVIQSPLVVC